MMRRLSYILLPVLLFAACNKENQEPGQPEWDGPVIELSLACVNPSDPTKAGSSGTEEGENPYHENDIKWVDFYFYPDGKTTEQASYHIRKVSGKRYNDVFRLELTTNQVNYLIFPVHDNITAATVFAIANAPLKDNASSESSVITVLDDLDDTSLSNILSQVVSADFAKPVAEGGHLNHRQDQLVMSGQTILTLAGRSQKVVSQGTVQLIRYASKITVGIKTEKEVEVDTEVWTPRLWSMQLYLENGVSRVALSGNPAGTSGGVTLADDIYFGYSENRMQFFDENKVQYFDRDGDFYNTFPMYTYPVHWEPGEEKEPYLKLVMTWDRKSGGQKEFYYKILIPQDRRGGEFLNSFVRNNWYHYDIEVGVLGADTDEEAVTLPANLYIVDWQVKEVVVNKANIGNARYLSVEDTEFTMYNQDFLSIRYTTSNPVEIKNIHVTRPYYGEDRTLGYNDRFKADVKKVDHSADPTYDDIYPDGSYYLDYSKTQREALDPDGKDWLQVNTEKGVIEYKHILENTMTKTNMFDYSPYTITFEVGHADNTQAWMNEYDKKVKIVQNPAIYIDATPNPDDIVDKGNNSTTAHHGYVYINNELDWYTQEKYWANGYPASELWRVIAYNGGGTDMYRVNATVLGTDSGYVIGDPRSNTVNNIREYAKAPAIEGGSRTLTWYYPTDESARTANMIAPSFRISTKLSGSARGTEISREQATYRCPAFQENGFPAGRWRLPTMAEIQFVAQLSANDVFEVQFDRYYWSANGMVYVDKGSGTVRPETSHTTAFIRCVYDSWYWGDDRVLNPEDNDMPSIFKWGDAVR